jgi:hypothetical protein
MKGWLQSCPFFLTGHEHWRLLGSLCFYSLQVELINIPQGIVLGHFTFTLIPLTYT